MLRLFSRFLHLLPRHFQLFLGKIIGFLWFDVFRIRRQVALDNISRAFPELSTKEHVRIGRGSLFCLGQTFIEFLLMIDFRESDVPKYFEYEGLEKWNEPLNAGKGFFLLTMHLGNGDFGCLALSMKDYLINLISKEFKSKALNDFWFGLRRKHGTRFIAPEKSSFDILKALKRNEVVIFVLDQFMGPPVGVRTTFFNQETGTAAGLAVFAEKTQAPVYLCYTVRMPNGKLRIINDSRIPFEKTGDRGQDIQKMTQAYTTALERVIRQYPEQWMWIHRRWKEFRD